MRRRSKGKGRSHMKFWGTEATGGQARFWSLLGVSCLLHILGDCHKCLGKAERELVASAGQGLSICVCPVTSGSRTPFWLWLWPPDAICF